MQSLRAPRRPERTVLRAAPLRPAQAAAAARRGRSPAAVPAAVRARRTGTRPSGPPRAKFDCIDRPLEPSFPCRGAPDRRPIESPPEGSGAPPGRRGGIGRTPAPAARQPIRRGEPRRWPTPTESAARCAAGLACRSSPAGARCRRVAARGASRGRSSPQARVADAARAGRCDAGPPAAGAGQRIAKPGCRVPGVFGVGIHGARCRASVPRCRAPARCRSSCRALAFRPSWSSPVWPYFRRPVRKRQRVPAWRPAGVDLHGSWCGCCASAPAWHRLRRSGAAVLARSRRRQRHRTEGLHLAESLVGYGRGFTSRRVGQR